ncbi:hypothetical protein ACFTY7_47030 [Streptomyces sp. NPDC057062]|uniref:hypothetical protein n=1 Tax=Streptomyces sp. NPDC057062 TaxID=3346011 RepID=UPI00363046CC
MVFGRPRFNDSLSLFAVMLWTIQWGANPSKICTSPPAAIASRAALHALVWPVSIAATSGGLGCSSSMGMR